MSRVREASRKGYIARRGKALTMEERLTLSAAYEILDRALARGEALADPSMAGRYMQMRLKDRESESFAVLYLDTRHRVIQFAELFHGSIDGAEVHPREVVRGALLCNAAAVICAHNHPSGNSEPGAADRAVTARLKQALAVIDVRLLDHFVIGDGPPESLAAKGWV